MRGVLFMAGKHLTALSLIYILFLSIPNNASARCNVNEINDAVCKNETAKTTNDAINVKVIANTPQITIKAAGLTNKKLPITSQKTANSAALKMLNAKAQLARTNPPQPKPNVNKCANTNGFTAVNVPNAQTAGFNGKNNWNQGAHRVSAVNKHGRKAAMLSYPKGKIAYPAAVDVPLWQGLNPKAVRISVDLYISEGFDTVIGGKLFGISGGKGAAGGKVAGKPGCANKTGGWSSRVNISKSNRPNVYSYHQNRKTACNAKGNKHGQIYGGKKAIPTGRWVTFEQQIVMNSPGKADGSVTLWMDGQPMVRETGLMYQKDSHAYPPNAFRISNMIGGNYRGNPAKKDMYVLYSNLRASYSDGPKSAKAVAVSCN